MARLSDQTGRGGSRGLPSSHEGRDSFTDARGNLLNSSEGLTSGGTAIAVGLDPYETLLTTGATAGSEDVNVGDGSTAKVGQRKLVPLETRSDASDVVNLDHANMVDSDGSTALTNMDLDAAGEFWLGEWNGTAWVTLYTNGTKTT